MSKETAFDPSRRIDIFLRINRVNARTLSFFNADSSEYILTYVDLQLFIKRYPGDLQNQLLLTIGNGLTVVDNQVLIQLTAAQSQLSEGEYYWELYNVDTGQTWLNGNANFHNGKFDGVTESGSITIGTEDPISVTLGQTIIIGEGGGGIQSIVAGANITVDNTDPENPIVIAQDQPNISATDLSTGGATLTLNFDNYKIVFFRGQTSFASAKNVALSNDTNALEFHFKFEITNVAATLDFGSGSVFKMNDSRFNAGTQVLTLTATGIYLLHGVFDNTNWNLELFGSSLTSGNGTTVSGSSVNSGGTVTANITYSDNNTHSFTGNSFLQATLGATNGTDQSFIQLTTAGASVQASDGVDAGELLVTPTDVTFNGNSLVTSSQNPVGSLLYLYNNFI